MILPFTNKHTYTYSPVYIEIYLLYCWMIITNKCLQGSILTHRNVEYTEWERIWSVLLLRETSTNVFLTMCSRPGLWCVWQEAVRMTNEDLCSRMRTASEDSHVLLRQILRADGRHSEGILHRSWERRQNTDVSQQGALGSFHKDCRYTWT